MTNAWITPAMTTADTRETATCKWCDATITRDYPGQTWRTEGTDYPTSCTVYPSSIWHSPRR